MQPTTLGSKTDIFPGATMILFSLLQNYDTTEMTVVFTFQGSYESITKPLSLGGNTDEKNQLVKWNCFRLTT